jgi:signal transduction histidine kinase/CheY-like chemotaxis protein
VGRRLKEFIPREEHARAEERLEAILKGEDARPSEWTGLRRQGGTVPWEVNGGLLRNPDGSPYAFFFILRDLIQRKRVERAIRWAEKLESLGLMAAGIAHELNNAFQVTQGNLELAQELCGEREPLAGILSRIGGGVDRATALAREMLDYSGRTLRGDEPLNVNRVVEEGLAVLRDFLTSDVCLVFVPGKGLPTAQGDEGQLIKVLSALVTNAVEAMEGLGGSVVIATEIQELTEKDLGSGFWPAPLREGRFLRLEVRDTGAGIPKKQLERVCDPFFTTKGQGRGLGLSAALGILRAHSACLQILSKESEGTAVRAFLPVSSGGPAPLPPAKASAPAASGILVADDDDSIRELVVPQLEAWGFNPVFAARNGAEALELFKAHQESIGIVLTDASMPQMSGPQAFEAMRKLRPTLLGVLMTGYSDAFCQGTATAFGFTSFLNKPFRFKELKAKLSALEPGQGAHA